MAEKKTTSSVVERLELRNFTAFEHLDVEFAPGINVFIGDNGTGKTHLLKAVYVLEFGRRGPNETETAPGISKIIGVYAPFKRKLGHLVNNSSRSQEAIISSVTGGRPYQMDIKNRDIAAIISGYGDMTTESFNCWVYIPPKDILSNAPGFTSLYNAREVAFEETYADLVSKCLLPDLRAEPDGLLGTVLSRVRNSINGEVVIENENFFLKKRGKKTEFMLVAEGFRKLALLDVLIRNGTIAKGSTLLWDEPEANLNPKLLGVLIDCLLDLQRAGVQIFLATHHYQILKRLDLQKKEKDSVRYHSLYREGGKPDGRIRVNSVDELALVDPNPILDSYTEIYNKELERIL